MTGKVMSHLDRSAVEMICVSPKREDADRKLVSRLQREMAVLPPQRTTMVILSGDMDFVPQYQHARAQGFTVCVIHGGGMNDGNKAALSLHADIIGDWQVIMAPLIEDRARRAREQLHNSGVTGARRKAEAAAAHAAAASAAAAAAAGGGGGNDVSRLIAAVVPSPIVTPVKGKGPATASTMMTKGAMVPPPAAITTPATTTTSTTPSVTVKGRRSKSQQPTGGPVTTSSTSSTTPTLPSIIKNNGGGGGSAAAAVAGPRSSLTYASAAASPATGPSVAISSSIKPGVPTASSTSLTSSPLASLPIMMLDDTSHVDGRVCTGVCTHFFKKLGYGFVRVEPNTGVSTITTTTASSSTTTTPATTSSTVTPAATGGGSVRGPSHDIVGGGGEGGDEFDGEDGSDDDDEVIGATTTEGDGGAEPAVDHATREFERSRRRQLRRSRVFVHITKIIPLVSGGERCLIVGDRVRFKIFRTAKGYHADDVEKIIT